MSFWFIVLIISILIGVIFCTVMRCWDIYKDRLHENTPEFKAVMGQGRIDNEKYWEEKHNLPSNWREIYGK